MSDKNIQLHDDNNNNLFPKTKYEIVMIDTTKTLKAKLVEIDASISNTDTKATNAQNTINTLNTEISNARVDTSSTPTTHTNLKSHLDKIWTQLKTAATNAANAASTANQANTAATNAQNTVTKLENTVNNLNNSMIKYREI